MIYSLKSNHYNQHRIRQKSLSYQKYNQQFKKANFQKNLHASLRNSHNSQTNTYNISSSSSRSLRRAQTNKNVQSNCIAFSNNLNNTLRKYGSFGSLKVQPRGISQANSHNNSNNNNNTNNIYTNFKNPKYNIQNSFYHTFNHNFIKSNQSQHENYLKLYCQQKQNGTYNTLRKKPLLIFNKKVHQTSNPNIYKANIHLGNSNDKQNLQINSQTQRTTKFKQKSIKEEFQQYNQFSNRMNKKRCQGNNINFSLKSNNQKYEKQQYLFQLPLKQNNQQTIELTTTIDKQKEKQYENVDSTVQLIHKWKQYAIIQPCKKLFLCKICLQFFSSIQKTQHYKNCKPPYFKISYKEKYISLINLIDTLIIESEKKINIFAQGDFNLVQLLNKMQDILKNKVINFQQSLESLLSTKHFIKGTSIEKQDLFWLLQKLLKGMNGLILKQQNSSFNFWKLCRNAVLQ